jgi:hypothetical protein
LGAACGFEEVKERREEEVEERRKAESEVSEVEDKEEEVKGAESLNE